MFFLLHWLTPEYFNSPLCLITIFSAWLFDDIYLVNVDVRLLFYHFPQPIGNFIVLLFKYEKITEHVFLFNN